VSTSGIEHVQY